MISTNDSFWKAIKKSYFSIQEELKKEEEKELKNKKEKDDEKEIENLEVDLDQKTLEKIIGKNNVKKTLSDYANDLFNRVRTIVKKAEVELDNMSFAKSQLPNKELKKALRELGDKITEISLKLKNYKPEEDKEDEEDKKEKKKSKKEKVIDLTKNSNFDSIENLDNENNKNKEY